MKFVWADEKKKIHDLPRKEALRYIWMYFKIPIIVFFVFLSAGIFLWVHFANNIPENWLCVTFANTSSDAGTGSRLWKSFTEEAGYDLTQKKVVFDDRSYFDFLKNQAKGNAYYNAFVTLVDVGELDAIVMEADSLAALGQSGRLMDLSDEHCASLFEKYHDRLIYYRPVDETGTILAEIPIGFDLSDSILMTEYHMYGDSCAIGVCAKSENIEEIERFIQFVLGERIS